MSLRSHHSQVYGLFLQIARIGFSYSALAFVFLLLPYGRSVTRRLIGETLPNDALKRPLGALYIVHTKTNTVAISEIELRKISMQVLLFAMLVDAFHATQDAAVSQADELARSGDMESHCALSAHVSAKMQSTTSPPALMAPVKPPKPANAEAK